MKYRAIAIGVEKDGKPLQIYAQSLSAVQAWAKEIHQTEKVPINVFVSEERLLTTIYPEAKE